MTLPVLRQIKSLVTQGAVLVGGRPTDSPSLADDEKEFQREADQLWGGRSAAGQSIRKVGKGKVYSGMSANDVLAALGVARDWAYTKPEADTTLMLVHRKLDDGDAYFVDNRQDRVENVDTTFRVEGKAPELWDPATGATQPVSYRIAAGRTTVPLHLDPFGTTFVVFRAPAAKSKLELPMTHETVIDSLNEALNGDWSVSFERGKGVPETVGFDHLVSWTEMQLPTSDDGVKYFSGTATYSKTIEIPPEDLAQGTHLWLDLGDVREIADVAVNGADLGILWKTPFKVDVTGEIRPGKNRIEIRVTNLWVNRMIGDQQSWAMKKYAFAGFTPYKADSPLLPSGLLGPVRLISVAETQAAK
jgi:hypothetical protein